VNTKLLQRFIIMHIKIFSILLHWFMLMFNLFITEYNYLLFLIFIQYP